ncbi:filamentous hemagglutinin N-terminal domain-containing protein [Aulosira sp. FACHB-113]|nr:filamentous hemagglutinin N-terminal domain-containing protein [Aulosira sp. FACHB-113]
MVSTLTYLTLAHFSLAKAQIIPDNTLGTETSVVNLDTIKGIPSERIDGGAIRGANLFHSFSEFNIDSGRGAYFTNPSGIENILTRVTGKNASQILGTLGVLGNANLFLMNPNGIIFGKDAVLDIRGSFTATTADGIKLGENGLFSATNPQSSNLLTVKPGALFSNALSNQQGTINNQGNLKVDAGNSINLLAANVINTGTLTAPEGIVQLTGTENLITRGNIATATLFLNTKNLTIGENNNATVDKNTLEGLSGNTNLILQATNDITVDSLTNSTLNLADGSGKIAFIADADRNGIGNFQMDTADTIKTNGRDISISGASLNLGNIDTSLIKGRDIFAVAIDAGGDIPANGTEQTNALFTFTVSDSQTIEDLDVQFSASHIRNSVLDVYLTSPSATTLELFYLGIGNNARNFQDTLLDDSADKNINNASPPFQGRFKPIGVGGLASFNGENTAGIWKLIIMDYPLRADSSGILHKAGETAPWGTADGTKLMFRTYISGNSGAITLNATNGSLNVGNINAGNATTAGEVNLSATKNISLNGSLAAVNKIKILADVDANGIGDFQMNPANTIRTNGRNTEIAGVNLTVGNINTSSQQGGGNITLTATGGNISTQDLNSYSGSLSEKAGSGGAIALTTTKGNISTGNMNSSSRSESGNAGDGGAIALTTTQGNISTGSLDSYSFSFSGNAGDGGAIALTTTQGNISTGVLHSYSFSFSGNAGDGGAIALTTTQGNISTQGLNSTSLSISASGNASSGGAIALTTTQGNISTGYVYAFSDSGSGNAGNGGVIALTTTQGNISTQDLNSFSISGSGNAGDGGAIALTTTQGNITTKELYSYSRSDSESGNAGSGGAIALTTTQGNISTGEIDSFSLSHSGNAGNGGAIALTTTQGNISIGELLSLSSSASGNAGNGGIITLSARDGNIIPSLDDNFNTRTLSSFSISNKTGNSGEGGNVTLEAKNLITNLDILTLSSADKSGDVKVNGFGDLSLINTNIITSKQVTINVPFVGGITLDVGGVGQSGNVNIISTGNLTFKDSRIESDTKGDNPAGNVNITSPGTVTFNNSKIVSNTSNIGRAGNIQINANNLTLTDSSPISASTTAEGKAGDITLNSPTVTLANGGKIFATTTGKGNGGTITVNAPNLVNLGIGVQDFAPILSVETSGAGKAGNIIVNTPSLTVSDTARITATATNTATNTEGGGSITLNASKLDLAGIVGIFAETQGQAPAGTLKLNPYANQANLDITLFPNSNISASTSGSGKGGDLILTAPENINIAGKGKLAVESTSIGDAGNIQITTQNLNINDGVKISASTMNGQGGNININANTLTANNGGQFLTTTSGTAKAGNINVKVRDNITLDGTNTGLFANTEKTATGDSGNITIDPEIFTIKNGAGIGVNSNGSGKGGNISLTAGTLTLDNQAFINAATASNTGGEITLDIKDFLFLRHNSNITASAGTDKAGGNGGNITINSPFIIAVNQENSDITANAYSGKGGNINIFTQGLFGIGFQAQDTQQSAITASSELGINGNVTINTPEVDPSKGLVQLPTNVADASGKIDNSCNSGSKYSRSSFTITGRGGLPSNPYESQQADSVIKTWVTVDDGQNINNHSNLNQVNNQPSEAIVEAQGLIRNENGELLLVSEVPKVIPHSPTLTSVTCSRK